MLLRSVVSILRNQDTEILLVHAETPTPGWTGTFISCGLLPWSGTAAPEGAHPVAGCRVLGGLVGLSIRTGSAPATLHIGCLPRPMSPPIIPIIRPTLKWSCQTKSDWAKYNPT